MATPLANLLIDMATDPAAAKRFWEDPQSVADNAGLDESQTRAVIARDPAVLGQALGVDFAARGLRDASEDAVNITIVVVVAP